MKMECDDSLSDILQDVGHFLDVTLANERLSSKGLEQKEKLLMKLAAHYRKHSVPPATDDQSSDHTNNPMPYLPMKGTSSNYVDTDVPETEDFYETFDEPSEKVSSENSKETLQSTFEDADTVSLDIDLDAVNYEPISAKDLASQAQKFGPLEKKHSRGIHFDPFGKCWCGIKANLLYLYSKEKDIKQNMVIDLCGYEVRPAPGIMKDVRKKERCFEIVYPGKRSYQFLARSVKDMDQWFAAIERASGISGSGDGVITNAGPDLNQQKNQLLLPKPISRQLPSLPKEDELYDDIGISTTEVDQEAGKGIGETGSSKNIDSQEDYESVEDIYHNIDELLDSDINAPMHPISVSFSVSLQPTLPSKSPGISSPPQQPSRPPPPLPGIPPKGSHIVQECSLSQPLPPAAINVVPLKHETEVVEEIYDDVMECTGATSLMKEEEKKWKNNETGFFNKIFTKFAAKKIDDMANKEKPVSSDGEMRAEYGKSFNEDIYDEVKHPLSTSVEDETYDDITIENEETYDDISIDVCHTEHIKCIQIPQVQEKYISLNSESSSETHNPHINHSVKNAFDINASAHSEIISATSTQKNDSGPVLPPKPTSNDSFTNATTNSTIQVSMKELEEPNSEPNATFLKELTRQISLKDRSTTRLNTLKSENTMTISSSLRQVTTDRATESNAAVTEAPVVESETKQVQKILKQLAETGDCNSFKVVQSKKKLINEIKTTDKGNTNNKANTNPDEVQQSGTSTLPFLKKSYDNGNQISGPEKQKYIGFKSSQDVPSVIKVETNPIIKNTKIKDIIQKINSENSGKKPVVSQKIEIESSNSTGGIKPDVKKKSNSNTSSSSVVSRNETSSESNISTMVVKETEQQPISDSVIKQKESRELSNHQGSHKIFQWNKPHKEDSDDEYYEDIEDIPPSKEVARSSSTSHTLYKALFPYVAQQQVELSFNKGDQLKLLNKDYEDQGWWTAELRGRIGYIPKEYMAVLKE